MMLGKAEGLGGGGREALGSRCAVVLAGRPSLPQNQPHTQRIIRAALIGSHECRCFLNISELRRGDAS